jgi:hypothetical protein
MGHMNIGGVGAAAAKGLGIWGLVDDGGQGRSLKKRLIGVIPLNLPVSFYILKSIASFTKELYKLIHASSVSGGGHDWVHGDEGACGGADVGTKLVAPAKTT